MKINMKNISIVKDFLYFSDWLCSFSCGLIISFLFIVIKDLWSNGIGCYSTFQILLKNNYIPILIFIFLSSFTSIIKQLIDYCDSKGINTDIIQENAFDFLKIILYIIGFILSIIALLFTPEHYNIFTSILSIILGTIIFSMIIGFWIVMIPGMFFGAINYYFIKLNRYLINNFYIRHLWSFSLSIITILFTVILLIREINFMLFFKLIVILLLFLIILKLADIVIQERI